MTLSATLQSLSRPGVGMSRLEKVLLAASHVSQAA